MKKVKSKNKIISLKKKSINKQTLNEPNFKMDFLWGPQAETGNQKVLQTEKLIIFGKIKEREKERKIKEI